MTRADLVDCSESQFEDFGCYKRPAFVVKKQDGTELPTCGRHVEDTLHRALDDLQEVTVGIFRGA